MPAAAAPTASRRLPASPRCGCTWASRAACSSSSTTARSRSGRNSSPAMWRASRRAPTGYCGAILTPRLPTAPGQRRAGQRRSGARCSTARLSEASLGKIIEPLRGVHDVLPAAAPAWQHLERITREVFASYGYEEFRVPVIEQTQLFKRSIGDFTDIVEKEMFSFVDQGEDHITLRPEATAGIAARDDLERIAARGPAAGLVHGADVQTRTAAGGTLPAVPSDRCRGVRLRRARHRCGNHPAVGAAAAAARIDAHQAAGEFAGHARARAPLIETS